jgi:hypothetical protein
VEFDSPAGALVFPSSAMGNDTVGKMLVEHFSALENPRCAGFGVPAHRSGKRLDQPLPMACRLLANETGNPAVPNFRYKPKWPFFINRLAKRKEN